MNPSERPVDLPSQVVAEALKADWAQCQTRGPWIRNSLKQRIARMKADEARMRKAFNKPYMSEPTKWYADAIRDATEVLERALATIQQEQS